MLDKKTQTVKNNLKAASTKLEIPTTDLNPTIVNLMFGKTNYKAIYKAISEYLELVQAGKKVGKTRQQMLDWLNGV